MAKADKSRLIAAALNARSKAIAPYSKFQVGAALLAGDGEIISGANIESVSYGLTCCAERVALFKALSEGRTDFRAVAVAAALSGGPNAVRRVPSIVGRIRAEGSGMGC